MVKLIPYSKFEEILDIIEEEIKNIDSLKEKMVKEDNFYLNELEKLKLKEIIEKLDVILSNYKNKEEIGDKDEQ